MLGLILFIYFLHADLCTSDRTPGLSICREINLFIQSINHHLPPPKNACLSDVCNTFILMDYMHYGRADDPICIRLCADYKITPLMRCCWVFLFFFAFTLLLVSFFPRTFQRLMMRIKWRRAPTKNCENTNVQTNKMLNRKMKGGGRRRRREKRERLGS